MILKEIEKKEVTEIKDVVVGSICKCDVYKTIIFTSKQEGKFTRRIKSDEQLLPYYFNVTTYLNDWGNDSCESYEHFEKYLDDCKSTRTQTLEIEQKYI